MELREKVSGLRLSVSKCFFASVMNKLMVPAKMFEERVNAKTKKKEKHYRKQISLTSTIKRKVNYLR